MELTRICARVFFSRDRNGFSWLIVGVDGFSLCLVSYTVVHPCDSVHFSQPYPGLSSRLSPLWGRAPTFSLWLCDRLGPWQAHAALGQTGNELQRGLTFLLTNESAAVPAPRCRYIPTNITGLDSLCAHPRLRRGLALLHHLETEMPELPEVEAARKRLETCVSTFRRSRRPSFNSASLSFRGSLDWRISRQSRQA